ncbi:unnamed protein product [Urochloa humidicola]
MPDSADSLTSPDPDMPPRKPLVVATADSKLKKPLTENQRAAAEHAWPTSSSAPLESPAAGAGGLPPPHEEALHSLGLLDFARLDMHSDAPRPDLVAYYDPVCKCSFVHGVRVTVSRLGTFSVLKELVIVLPDRLADNFGSVIPRIEKALNDKSSTSNLKKYWNAS